MSEKIKIRYFFPEVLEENRHTSDGYSEIILVSADENNIIASDGYHTFEELYDHRIELFIVLCKKEKNTWRSKFHSDGSNYDGWFILGIGKEAGTQITYHLPISRWDDCDFAEILDKAPEWDGHNSEDVLKRLKML